MSLFLSTYINKIDQKGRVSVPASFRSVLDGSAFKGIVVFRSYRMPALDACSMDRMTTLSDSVDQLDLFSEDQDDFTATLFADAFQLPFDGDGRILLPADLIDFADLKGQAAFVGRGQTFQIWNPDAFKAHQADARERLRLKGATLKLNKGGDQ